MYFNYIAPSTIPATPPRLTPSPYCPLHSVLTF